MRIVYHSEACSITVLTVVLLRRRGHPTNATLCELSSNECVQCQCDKETGAIYWSMCNGTEEKSMICDNNQSVEKKETEVKIYIEVILKEGVKVSEFNPDEVLVSVREDCGIEKMPTLFTRLTKIAQSSEF